MKAQEQDQLPDVVRIDEAARRLGLTPSAIRGQIHRKVNQGKPVDLPAPVMLLGKWAWPRQLFDSWLAAKLGEAGGGGEAGQ